MAGLINYVKKVFKNYPDTTTPMTAENLNHLDDGIFNLDQAVNNALALKANKSLLTANSKTAQLTYSSGKYGFTINGTFYEIGGGSMRVVKTGYGVTSGKTPVTINLGETIAVNKYYVDLSGTQTGNKSGNVSGTIKGTLVGGVHIDNKTSTSFDIVAFSDNTNYSYQVIAFN